MEVQLVFRSLGQNIPCLMVVTGTIESGQFVSKPGLLLDIINQCDFTGDLIRHDDMFGSDPFIARKDLHNLFIEAYRCGHLIGAEFYDSFIVLKFNINEIKEETSKEEQWDSCSIPSSSR